MEIPREILECVAFIYIKDKKSEYKPVGTGFFVSVRIGEPETKGCCIYFVTAKHVIENVGDREISIRINTKGGPIHVQIAEGFIWTTHPGDSKNPVDIALVNITGIIKTLAEPVITHIPIEMLLGQEDIQNGNIQVGNEVFITGLFVHHHGKFANLPIVRSGNIAMLPSEDEKVAVSWHKAEIDAYLIEARSIGGISGSPVFFREPYFKEGGTGVKIGGVSIRPKPKFYLGGLIHGHWSTSSAKIDTVDDSLEESNVNMGIAIVTPAIKIHETLMHPQLVEERKVFGK